MKKIPFSYVKSQWWRIKPLHDNFYIVPFSNGNICSVLGDAGIYLNGLFLNPLIYNKNNIEYNSFAKDDNFVVSQNLENRNIPVVKLLRNNGYLGFFAPFMNYGYGFFRNDINSIHNWRLKIMLFTRDWFKHLSRPENKSFRQIYGCSNDSFSKETAYGFGIGGIEAYNDGNLQDDSYSIYDKLSAICFADVLNLNWENTFGFFLPFAKYTKISNNNYKLETYFSTCPVSFSGFFYIKNIRTPTSYFDHSNTAIRKIFINTLKKINLDLLSYRVKGSIQVFSDTDFYGPQIYTIKLTHDDHKNDTPPYVIETETSRFSLSPNHTTFSSQNSFLYPRYLNFYNFSQEYEEYI